MASSFIPFSYILFLFLFYSVFLVLRYAITVYPRLALNLLCSPGCLNLVVLCLSTLVIQECPTDLKISSFIGEKRDSVYFIPSNHRLA